MLIPLTLVSGGRIDLADPDYSKVQITDIAWGLAAEHRYNGQTPKLNTVAEHCVRITRWVRSPEAKDTFIVSHYSSAQFVSVAAVYDEYGYLLEEALLMHDAPEAVLGDIVGPMKRLPGFAYYNELEEMHMARAIVRFGLPDAMHPVWHYANVIDHAYPQSERVSLWSPNNPPWDMPEGYKPLLQGPTMQMAGWNHKQAYTAFMNEYAHIQHVKTWDSRAQE